MTSNRELMRYYDDIRFENRLRVLRLKYFLEGDKEKILLFEISNFIPRIWKDLDNMVSIDKNSQVTSRMTKLNSNSNRLSINAAKKVVDETEVNEFSFIDKLEETIYYTLLNLLKGSSKKVEITLNTINPPTGQLMLTVVSTYALGQEILKKFGEIYSSRRLEATIITKQKFEEQLREIFKNYSFEDAFAKFRELVDLYQEVLVTDKSVISQIAHEEFLYTIADLKDVQKNIRLITEKVRERITNQPRLLIVEED